MADIRFVRRGKLPASSLNNLQDETNRHRLFFDETTQGDETTMGQGLSWSGGQQAGSGLTAVETRWYIPDFTGSPPVSGVDYLVDNTVLNQEGPLIGNFALQRGRFWHTVPELKGTTLIHHKFQKCFRG